MALPHLCKALPHAGIAIFNKAMLTGEELGAAIEAARVKKGVSKVALADAMKVKPASIQDWVKHGRIAKHRINDLVAYFSDVVGPEHWGLDFVMPQADGARQVAEVKHFPRRDLATSVPYDRDLLRETVIGMTNGITNRGLHLSAEKQAELLILIYEHFATQPRSERGEVVERLLRLVS